MIQEEEARPRGAFEWRRERKKAQVWRNERRQEKDQVEMQLRLF